MTALLFINTGTREVRRYTPQVLAGIRRAKVTHACAIESPQADTLTAVLKQFLQHPAKSMSV